MSLSISLIETFVTDDGLNSMISACKDLDKLDEMLDIKLELVEKQAHTKTVLPLDNVLNNINKENLDKACSVLEKLLILQSDDIAFTHFQWHINNYISEIQTDEKEKLMISINLIISLLKVYRGQTKIKLSLEKLLKGLMFEEEELLNRFLTCILPKYAENCNSKYLFELINTIIKAKRLDIFTSIINLFLVEDLSHEIGLLINDLDFWKLVGDGLYISQKISLKRQALHVLKSFIEFCINDNNLYVKSELIKLNSVSLEKTKEAWKTYFWLVEFLQDDRIIQLNEQSVGILPIITTSLHSYWGKIVYYTLLVHSHPEIVLSGVCNLLTSSWFNHNAIFNDFSKILVTIFNRVSYTNFSTKICPLITKFIQHCEEPIFVKFLKESCGVTWSPYVTWAFYKCVFCECPKFNVSLDLTKNILYHLDTLRDHDIKDGCAFLFMKYLCVRNVMIDYNFEGLLEIYRVINTLYSSMEMEIFSYLKPVIVSHQDSILNYVQSWENLKLLPVDYLEYVVKWSDLFPIKVNYPTEEIIDACFTLECVQVTDKIYLLRKACTDEEILEYLVKRLDTVDDTTNIEDVENIVQHIGTVFQGKQRTSLEDKLGENISNIILGHDKNMMKLQIAFEIAIETNILNEEEVISIWLEKYKVLVENIDERLRLKILMLYAKTIKRNPHVNINNELIKIIELTFEMQNHSAVHYIFTEFLPNIAPINTSLDSAGITEKIVQGIRNLKPSPTAKPFEVTNVRVCNFLGIFFSVLMKKGPEGAEEFLKIMEHFLSMYEYADSRSMGLVLTSPFYYTNIDDLAPKLGIYMDIFIRILNLNAYLPSDEISRIQQEIHEDILFSTKEHEYEISPSIYEDVKMRTISTILRILNNQDLALAHDVADHATTILMEFYNSHINEEYSQGSFLYEQKLIIAQTLLVIQPFMKNTTELIQLIINSLCNENHQTNVKQTMQWLLIRLLNNNDNRFEIINNAMTSDNAAKVSIITNFIPVIYHLTLKTNKENWVPSIKLLLPLTMGVHLRSRIYAQTAIFNLYEQAKQRSNQEFLEKCGLWYTFAEQALHEAGDEVAKTLQDDGKLFSDFDPFDDYCIEEVFPGISSQYCNDFKSIPGTRRKTSKTEESANLQSVQKKDFSTETRADLILVATLVDHPDKLKGLSRTCAAFGPKQLIVGNRDVFEEDFKGSSMWSENWLDIIEVKEIDLSTYLQHIKKAGYTVVAVETTADNANLSAYKFAKKTVLVLGNGKEAIPPQLLPYMDVCIQTPQDEANGSSNPEAVGTTLIGKMLNNIRLKMKRRKNK